MGEGNGNPLQCSCLENPRDGGAWWEAVYGVTQSQTRLQRLSSSSSSIHSAFLSYKGASQGFPGGSVAKNPPAMQETWVRSLDQESLLEKEMATHSSILAWEIPWTRSLVGYSPWGCQESNTA